MLWLVREPGLPYYTDGEDEIGQLTMDLKKKLGLRIRAIRKAKGLTQEQLSDAAGISLTFIGVTERGKNIPSLKTCNRLAEALGVTLSELFNFSGDDEKETAIMALSSYLREKDTGQVRIVREIAEKIEHYGKSEK